jgi:hypothetical protein
MQTSVENPSENPSSFENPSKNKIAYITILVVFSVFILLSICLSSVALSKSLNNTSITPGLQTLASNTAITSTGCLSATCFTDNFVKSSQLSRNVANTFSVSKGNIECQTITIGNSLMDTTALTFQGSDQSSLFSADSLHFTSGSNTLVLNQTGIQSDTVFKMEANMMILDKTLQLGSFTTTQRLALSPSDGTLVYDNTIGSMAVFQNGSWLLLTSSTGVQTLQVVANQLVSTGPSTTPTIGLATTTITSGVYIAPTVTFDSFGRATAAVSHPNTVTNLTILTNQLVNTGTLTAPILGLANINNSDGDFTWASFTADNQGRITNITENPTPVLSVTGTTNQINVTSGSNPIVSLNSGLLSSIQFWQALQPSGIPSQLQFLQYQGTSLAWTSLGSGTFPISRNIYVDKSGNDTTGNGSNITPFLTVAKAIAIANAGNTTDSNQVAIYVGAGIYFEVNPILITVSGINIIGASSIGTWIAPNDPSSNLLTMTNGIVTFENILFQALPSTSTATCIAVNGTFTLYLTSCSFRFFQTALICNGVSTNASAGIFNNCIYVENQTSCLLSAGTIIMGNSQIIGSLSGTSLHNGFIIDSINSLLFVGGGTSFLSCAMALLCTNQSKAYLSALNFTNNVTNTKALSGSVIRGVGCNMVIMDTNYISVYVSDPTSKIILNACSIDGFSALNANAGTGAFVTNQGSLQLQACYISHCATGLLIGIVSDTASTLCSCTNSDFSENTISIDVDGTCTFNGVFLNIDDASTLIFDSTPNINLVFSDPNLGINVGTLTNETINVLGIATKLIDASSLVYNPNVYNQETLLYTNPDVTANTSLGTVSQLDSHHDILSLNPNAICGIRMYSDLSNFDGSQIRGWHIYKNGTSGTLNFDYNNNITGQLTSTNTLMMRLDAVNNSVFLASNTLSWTNGTTLYESSPNTLKTDNNFIIGGLTPNSVVVTDTNSKLVSSATTLTQLGYLSTTTSDVQIQLNNKVSRLGDTMTGALGSSFAGSASSPNFAVNNAGIYSSAPSNISLATNNQNRLNINSSGNVTILGLAGIARPVKTDVTGQLISSMITGSDIATSTIPNSKLSELSSINTPLKLVVRDTNGSFESQMITLAGMPVNLNDVATKGYVDNVVALGLTIKDPVLVVDINPITSPPTGPQTIDDVILVDGNRVLLINQALGEEKYNGAWVVNTSGLWTRPLDFSSGTAAATAYFLVQSGTLNKGSSFVCVTPMAIIDTEPLSFSQFSLPQDVDGSNVGLGTGLVFENAVGTVLHFRSLLSLNNLLTIVDSGSGEVNFDIKTSSANSFPSIVARDGSGNFSASNITATNFFGLASLNLALTGNQTISGPVLFQNGTFTLPNLAVGSANTGISASSGVLQFSTAGALRLSIDTSGILTVPSLSTTGVVHANGSILTSSKIVDADITLGTITNASHNTISSSNTTGTIVVRDGSGNFSANTITASLTGNVTGNLLGNVTGHSSLDLALTGGTLSGPLIGSAGTFAFPGVAIGDTITGLSFSFGTLQLSTSGVLALSINSSGTIFMPLLITQGVMHIAASGLIQVSQVSTSEIADGAITDAKIMGPLTTAGLVSNTATTASSALGANTIVLRDGSNNFAAGTITATLTGSASLNLLLTGGTLTGNLVLPNGSSSVPSLQVGSATVGLSASAGILQLNTLFGTGLSIASSTGIVSLPSLTTIGIVHNTAAGLLSTSLIVNADVDPAAAIVDTKLATISTVGKVSNTATSASSALGANTIVLRDGSNNFAAGTITATLTGSASLNLLLTGGTLTGNLVLPNGSSSVPSLQVGSATVGLSASAGILQLNTLFGTGLSIASVTGIVSLPSLTTIGIVHNTAAGLLSTSLIVNADVDPAAAIVDTKLATISTVGKVSNSATTASSALGANTIVLRDGSNNFAAGTITATLTGSASLNLLLTGGTLTGNLVLPNGSSSVPSLQVGSATVGLSASAGILQLNTLFGTGLSIASVTGIVSLPSLTTIGIVHNTAAGLLSTSLIVNADVDPAAAIVDTKLATISTVGKVSNTATTATASLGVNTIVLRDGSNNFTAGTITANLTGNVTGSASLNLLLTGGTLSGAITGTTMSQSAPSAVGIYFTGTSVFTFTAATAKALSWNGFATTYNILGSGNWAVTSTSTLNGQLQYLGATTQMFNISITFTVKASNAATTFSFFVAKNPAGGVAIAQPVIYGVAIGGPLLATPMTVTRNVQLATNDFIQLGASSTATLSSVTLGDVSYDVIQA